MVIWRLLEAVVKSMTADRSRWQAAFNNSASRRPHAGFRSTVPDGQLTPDHKSHKSSTKLCKLLPG